MSPHPMARIQSPPGGRFGAGVLRLVVVLALAGVAASPGATAADASSSNSATARRTLTLSQAEESALRNQPTLRQAHAQTDAAQGRVEQARSGYLPQAALTGTYQRTSTKPQPRPGINTTTGSIFSISFPTSSVNYFTFGIQVS